MNMIQVKLIWRISKRFISKELDPIYDIISPVVSSMIKFYQKETNNNNILLIEGQGEILI